ncbi:MAG: sigma-54-dependent Fis family transcriptional regulator [Pseudomonadota bacterium]|nr:sigma-54-dependent Fis family transcriptional regulator [Pseudomonadota bacterium]
MSPPSCDIVHDASSGRTHCLRNFVGNSPAFLQQKERIHTFAACDAGVLILGETGTGKEICAQSIHYLSARASRPWVAVNCGAVPTELIESELFGHVRGAFTSAQGAREGLVAEAEGGTLLLDDVDCLSLAAQAKLLRFVQEQEYRPVGCNAVRRCDVRVIASSNRDLHRLALQGAFRQDLYFRLNVLTLNLPALRERSEDIRALSLHFLALFARRLGRPAAALGASALRRLMAHDWPGNVRELEHAIERAVLTFDPPVVLAEHLDLEDAQGADPGCEPFGESKARVVQRFERDYLERVLASCGGNVTRAAQLARKNRRAFFELIRKHQIEPSQFRTAGPA